MSTLLYGAELWPLSAVQKKNWKLPITRFSDDYWKDKVRNEEVRQRTNLKEINLIIKERRLRWLGHVLRMEDDRIPKCCIGKWTTMSSANQED